MTDPQQPSLVQHARLQQALDAWAERKDAQTHSDALRRAMSGQLLLDISASTFADPDNPMQQGDTLAVASVRDADGKDLLLAFTDNDRLRAFTTAEEPRSLAQSGAATLEHAIAQHEGIAIDAGTDGAFIAYADEISRAFGANPADAARLASATTDGGVPLDEFLGLLRDAVVYVGGIPVAGEDGEVTGYRIATATRADGGVLHAVFSSPAELWAWTPDAMAQPTTIDRIVESARDDGMAGLVVNPVGPSAELELAWFDRAE
ncbi:hypothetical protein GCM10027064_05270 [Microbacterium petrolearium]